MQNKLSEWNKNKIYFTGLISILLSSAVFLIFNGKTAAFISLNSYHPFLLNVFFINYTFIGDGIFALCLIAAMFFYLKKKQQGFALLYSFLISGIAVQIIKNLTDSPRPKLFFEAGQYLHFIDGVTLANNSSFPSGHTATAFAIATVMVLMMKNKSWQLFILISAILVGYSRIYLAQHFLIDIIIGSLTGSLSGIVSVYLIKNSRGIKGAVKKWHRINNIQPAAPPPDAIQTV
jgi:membrane-associated phospholipid phosphatase